MTFKVGDIVEYKGEIVRLMSVLLTFNSFCINL